MPELNDNDLHELFRIAGHSAPGTDLTARIMARVSVVRVERPVLVEPLIGKRGWAIATAGAIVLMGFAIFTGGNGTTAPAWLGPITEVIGHIRPPRDWAVWTLGTTACALLFTVADRILAHRTAA